MKRQCANNVKVMYSFSTEGLPVALKGMYTFAILMMLKMHITFKSVSQSEGLFHLNLMKIKIEDNRKFVQPKMKV